MDSGQSAFWQCFAAALLTLLGVANVSGYGFSGGNVRLHNELACEGYDIHLRCPGKDIISIQAAAYGRQDDMTCVVENHEMQDMHCRLPNAKEMVAKRCNGNTSCDFQVGSEVFRDPCPGTKKYLNVMYECVPFMIVCPGKLRGLSSPTRKRTSLEDNAAWMRDPYQVSERLFYMGYTKFLTGHLFEYETIEDVIGGNPAAFYHLREAVDGTGFVVYDRSLFFTPEGTNQIKRYDLTTQAVEATVHLPGANYGGTSPYSIGLSTDIDLAVDESGLWAIYATEYNQGNIVISRLRHHNLEIVKTWPTEYDKLSALNAFVVCGALYVINYDTLRIDYVFNTTSGVGTNIDVFVPGLRGNVSAVNYNPKEQKLYVWDRKMAVTYNVDFEPIAPTPPTTVRTTTMARKTTTSRVTTTTKSTTISSTTLAPPVARPRPKCPSIDAGGVQWPSTEYGAVSKVGCPGSYKGNAVWQCGGNATHPRWVGVEPDFSQCLSEWIREIETELKDGRSSAAKLGQKLTDTLRRKVDIGRQLDGWDITKCVKLLRDLLDKATSERESAALVTGYVLKTASLLLDPSLEESWNALTFVKQNEVSSDLIRVVEDTAFFLAYDLSTNVSGASGSPAQNKLNWSEKMIALGIRVDPAPGDPSGARASGYEKITWFTGQGDTVRLDTNSVLDAIGGYGISDPAPNRTTTRHLAVVLLSFRNLGQYMKDGELYETHPRPVNSRILSVSAASITRTTEASGDGESSAPREISVRVSRHHNLDLERPLRMTIAHKRSGSRNHVCAFWDDKGRSSANRWWRRGCYSVAVNSTHSTCECEHLTSFSVLSSDAAFPAMGYEAKNEGGPSTIAALVVQRDLPILRAGLGISLFLLVIVAATLFPLSASKRLQSDINTVHKNLILSLIITEVVFMCGIDRTVVPDVCGAVAGLLHFGLLATFTWAALEAYHLMAILGDVTERRDRWRWYYAVGYGTPTLVVAVSAAADHSGYGTVAVCWLKTDSNFIWSFIGPCCFVILCCIVFLSMTLYRLHLYSVTFSEAPKHKSVRSGVARSCALMFLLCALWSCGVLWLSNFQPRTTAILFCILSAFYGIAAFFLHCILPSEVRSCYSSCFSRFAKRSDDLSRHRRASTNSHGAMLGSIASRGGTLCHDTTTASSYGGYYTTRTGITTTLLPVSEAVAQGRCASDMDITRTTCLDSAYFPTQRGRSEGSAFDVASETAPNNPTLVHTHPGHGCDTASWSDNHRYEQPLPQIPNCSTVASRASGHYNHLHEHCANGAHQVAPTVCRHHQPRYNHHYETMDQPLCRECPSELGVQVQMGENGEPQAVHYRHCYDDTQHRNVAYTAPIRRTRGSASFPCSDSPCDRPGSMGEMDPPCHGRPALTSTNPIREPQSALRTNRGYLTQAAPPPSYPSSARRGHIQMGTVGLSKPTHEDFLAAPQRRQKTNSAHYPSRAGRSSDPLSTDQGYDTDSQQQGCRGCSDSHSDHSCSPRPSSRPKAILVVRSVDAAVLPTITAAEPESQQHRIVAPIPVKAIPNPIARRNSELSECASENDREVERIYAAASGDSNASSPSECHGDSGNSDGDDLALNCSAARDQMIDTARGGRLSVAESVTSWCAHAGSNPRAVNAAYGKGGKATGKRTTDPSVILAGAKVRAENGAVAGARPQGRSKTYVYTLPGTAASGTKAKIDLKNGGISMITNL